MKRIIQYSFEECDAHRIIAMCNPENIPSWKVMERLNMRREGHLKKQAFFKVSSKGKPLWHDSYLYAILKEEFFEKYK